MAVRPALRDLLARVAEVCTNCGLCGKECGFLKKYGLPKEIAEGYDPAVTAGQVMPFECSLCRLCEAVCPFGAEPASLFLEMRREAVDREAGAFSEHRGLLAYETKGMSRRFTWYGLPEGCESVFFPGCALPGTRPERTREVWQALRKGDPRLGIVLDCCGKISHDLGREAYFTAMFGEMKDYLAARGVKEIIVACPNCYNIFSRYGDGLRVRTVYEALPAAAEAPSLPGRDLVIHDPCGVRFYDGAGQAVRHRLAATGLPPREMRHTGSKTFCCGSGAGVNALSPDLADLWTDRIREEAEGRPIVTYCCGCADRLDGPVKAVHALDVLNEPEAALAGKSKVSRAPFTYLNRLKLKAWFKKELIPAASRERTFTAAAKRGWAGRLAILATLVAAIVAVRMTGAAGYLDQDRLRELIAGYGMMAPLIYMSIYTLAPALLLPGLPITIAGGILFGPFWGVVYTITSATMGACLAFLISRYVAREWVTGKLRSPRWRRIDAGVERHGWKVVAFTRLIPLFPFNLLNYAFGLTRIGFWPYTVTTFVCMLPACVAFIVFSSSLLDLVRGRVSGTLLVGAALIVLVSLVPIIYRRRQMRKGRGDPL